MRQRLVITALVACLGVADATAQQDKVYTIEQKAPTDVTVGKSAVGTVTFLPKTGYHTNKDFPTNLKAAAPAEVALPKTNQKVPDAKTFTDQRAEFEIPFTATKPGTYEIAVDLKSAVCSKETCVPFREKFVWKVTAK